MAWRGVRKTYGGSGRSSEAVAAASPADLKSGFEQPLTDVGHLPPAPLPPRLRVSQAPILGGFMLGTTALGTATSIGLLDAGLPPGTIGKERSRYVPADTGDRIGHVALVGPGGFGIGRGALGYRRPFHGRITLGAAPGKGETETPS